MLKKSSKYTEWASEILDNFIEETSKMRKIELEYVLTEFFKLKKAFPRESSVLLITRTCQKTLLVIGDIKLVNGSLLQQASHAGSVVVPAERARTAVIKRLLLQCI